MLAGRNPRLLPYLCLLPAALLLGLVLYVPIAQTLVNAFYRLDRYGNREEWVGLQNFRTIFADPHFLLSLKNTLIWTIAVVLLTLLISMGIALFLHRRFPGRALARAILILPWASSLVISALLWRYLLDGELGPVNALLVQLGLIEEPIYWLSTWKTSFPAMIAVAVYVSIPFTAMVFLAGLQSLPQELVEAARVDGAGRWRVFVNIVLPHLRGVITIATIINVIYVFNSFPIVWTMTKGDPAGTTDIIMTALYKKAFTEQQFDAASAQATVVFVVLLVFSAGYSWLAGRDEVEA